jgi:hypothetical protein
MVNQAHSRPAAQGSSEIIESSEGIVFLVCLFAVPLIYFPFGSIPFFSIS